MLQGPQEIERSPADEHLSLPLCSLPLRQLKIGLSPCAYVLVKAHIYISQHGMRYSKSKGVWPILSKNAIRLRDLETSLYAHNEAPTQWSSDTMKLQPGVWAKVHLYTLVNARGSFLILGGALGWWPRTFVTWGLSGCSFYDRDHARGCKAIWYVRRFGVLADQKHDEWLWFVGVGPMMWLCLCGEAK